MTMRMTLAPKEVEDVLNLPGVIEYHWMDGRSEPIDTTPIFLGGGFGVVGDGVSFLFNSLGPNTYEVHTSVAPDKRGPNTKNYARQCADIVFTQTDAVEVFTRVPETNVHARKLAELAGFKQRWVNPKGWNGKPIATLSLPIQTWASRTNGFDEIGYDFHEQLKELGVETDHDYDPVHDKYVGISFSMARSGQLAKAVWFYNLWASLYGYALVDALQEVPPVISMLGKALTINNEGTLELV